MSTTREEGLAVLRRLVPDSPFNEDGELPTSDSFAAGLLDESLDASSDGCGPVPDWTGAPEAW